MQDRLGFRGALRALHGKANRRRDAVVVALALALVPGPAAAVPSLAVDAPARPVDRPALWVLSDSDTTIYLFGTFHALDERIDWLARPIRAAFDSSDELILETIVPTDPATLFGVLARNGLAAMPVVGAPVVGPARTSFANQARATMSASRAAGLSVDRGADAVLRRIADATGKPVDGLESFDSQVGMVTSLSNPAVAPAPATLPQPDARQVLLDMRSAWKRGDGSRFAAVLGSLEAQSPATYQRLFVDRNNDWARWIADRMSRPGTVFVAVGTGHLIGRDSLQQKLASRGYRTTRIK